MAGEIQLNSTTFATESGGTITVANVDSATNRQNLGLEIGADVQAFDTDTTKNDVANTFTANQTISVTDNTNAALSVTQLGTGNALIVNDEGSETTPFVIDASGNVGIGTSSPTNANLHIDIPNAGLKVEASDNIKPHLDLIRPASSNNYRIENDGGEFHIEKGATDTFGTDILRYFSDLFIFLTAGAERMRIDSSGNVSINRVGSTQSVTSGENGFFYNNTDGYLVLGNGDQVSCIMNRWTSQGNIIQFRYNGTTIGSISTNTYSLPSDRDFKKDINDLNLGLELVKKLKPKSYRHNIDDDNSPYMTGLVAQDLEESLADVGVAQNESWILQYNENAEEGNSKYELDYSKLIPVLTKAIQEQQALIESQQSQIDALTARIEALETA